MAKKQEQWTLFAEDDCLVTVELPVRRSTDYDEFQDIHRTETFKNENQK